MFADRNMKNIEKLALLIIVLWALLGLTSGLLAAVLYYLVRILRAIPGEAKTNC